jgi:hypothetical protein
MVLLAVLQLTGRIKNSFSAGAEKLHYYQNFRLDTTHIVLSGHLFAMRSGKLPIRYLV